MGCLVPPRAASQRLMQLRARAEREQARSVSRGRGRQTKRKPRNSPRVARWRIHQRPQTNASTEV